MPRLKLAVMGMGAFWAMLYVSLFLWKSWGYQHPDNRVAHTLVAIS